MGRFGGGGGEASPLFLLKIPKGRGTEREIMFTLEGELREQRRCGAYTGGEKVSTEGKTGPFWGEAS